MQLVAAGLCLIFASAFVGKLDGWRAWRQSAAQLFPGSVGIAVAVLVPAAEGAIAVSLLVEPKLGLVFAAGALATFGGGVLLLARRHSGRRCSCFGALAPSTISTTLGLRDLAIAGATCLVLYMGRGEGVASLSLGHVLGLVLVGLLVQLGAEAWRLRAVGTQTTTPGSAAR